MKKIILSILLTAVFSGGCLSAQASSDEARAQSDAGVVYQCPMHPQIIQDHPGSCPICGMHLNRVEKKTEASFKNEPKVLFYRNPMNPQVTSPIPAKDEMGMDYIAVYEDISGETLPVSDVSDHAAVKLTAEKIQMIGIQQAEVRRENLILPLRVTGTVFHNHEIYELLSEYRDAVQVEKRIVKPTRELIAQSRSKAAALRNKLRRYGIGEEVFKKAEEGLEDPTNFIPAHLIVAANGAYVDARLPAADAVRIALGQKARLNSSLFPDKALEGIVKSVDSIVDTETQTLGVRIEVQSGHEWLKPGLFVIVEIDLDLGERLVVPNTAVLNPGHGAYVFVEKPAGIFMPKHIETGLAAGSNIEILSGLQEKERVVISANFLLDSESRFQAARKEAGHD